MSNRKKRENNDYIKYKDKEANVEILCSLDDAGTTANRPTSPVKNQFYLDETLGKPIWFDGTDWIDATGATV